MGFEGLQEKGIDACHGLTSEGCLFSLKGTQSCPPSRLLFPVEDSSLDAEITSLIEDLLEEHEGFERAALRALARSYLLLLAESDRVNADADRSCSRGFLRGLFSDGARPTQADDEP